MALHTAFVCSLQDSVCQTLTVSHSLTHNSLPWSAMHISSVCNLNSSVHQTLSAGYDLTDHNHLPWPDGAACSQCPQSWQLCPLDPHGQPWCGRKILWVSGLCKNCSPQSHALQGPWLKGKVATSDTYNLKLLAYSFKEINTKHKHLTIFNACNCNHFEI